MRVFQAKKVSPYFSRSLDYLGEGNFFNPHPENGKINGRYISQPFITYSDMLYYISIQYPVQ